MAVTISLYNNTVKRLLNKEVTFTTLRVMLLNASASFVASHTTLNQVAGTPTGTPAHRPNEVYGNGWTEGGMTLANVTASVVTTNDAMLDADDVVATATGGPIGPAYAAVLYDDTDTNDAPLAYIDFGQAEQAGQDTDFKIVWNASGIISEVYA